MKRILYLCLFIISLGLVGCGEKEDADSTEKPKKTPQPRSKMDVLNQGMPIHQKTEKTLHKLNQPVQIPVSPPPNSR
ncbi:hypothetical protein [Legionella sp. W05-934-2]|jgi:hypothetical protein|uniref:hypothetical protein n=1 Tax=Legionella sp. W05-934-2 TaxID=1198649 RepID=UPI0034632586